MPHPSQKKAVAYRLGPGGPDNKPGMIAGHGPSSNSPVSSHEAKHTMGRGWYTGNRPERTEEQRAEAAKRRTEKFTAWKTKRTEKLKAAGKYDENKDYWWEKEGAEQQWAQRRRHRMGHWYGNHSRYHRRMRRRWGQKNSGNPVKPVTPGDTKNTNTSGS